MVVAVKFVVRLKDAWYERPSKRRNKALFRRVVFGYCIRNIDELVTSNSSATKYYLDLATYIRKQNSSKHFKKEKKCRAQVKNNTILWLL